MRDKTKVVAAPRKRAWLVPPLAALLAFALLGTSSRLQDWAGLRERMVRQTMERPLDGRPRVADRRVLNALRQVPRHQFVPPALRSQAYEDWPLPIGEGQTISQPYIVAKMTELLKPKADHRVLEVGTGSGYQAAVLSLLVKEVYSIEIIPELAEQARKRLQALGYRNVQVRAGDGYAGWPQAAPFDSVIVTAAPTHLPRPLLEQLKPGGRMVIPTGENVFTQELQVIHRGKTADDIRIEPVMGVRFVPLTGGHEKPPPKKP